ncbi:hypothetical protein LCGC14_1218080 [marine sediment metagenome]|uniref:Uncharacterized protein n=1 Tax=marine sediment metagenome TaxID=412755 RepID=A0A0F9LG55_9ZZZZ
MSEQPNSEAKHTPGPWSIGGDGADVFAGGKAPTYATARHIADCQPEAPGLLGMASEDVANAELIAAAPETAAQRDELLAVCEAMIRAWNKADSAFPESTRSVDPVETDMRAAVARAKETGR